MKRYLVSEDDLEALQDCALDYGLQAVQGGLKYLNDARAACRKIEVPEGISFLNVSGQDSEGRFYWNHEIGTGKTSLSRPAIREYGESK